jgi:methionyl-tRNA formyltransferase
MRIVIITQNDPFYLADNLRYLLNILPVHSKIVGCVVDDVSPFGKKENIFQKAKKTLLIFGFKFFIYYAFKFMYGFFSKKNNILNILKNKSIPVINLISNINSTDSVQKIKSYEPDLLISILGNQIFKKTIIDLAPKGCLNLHTSLLPKYRGLMPTFWVLKYSEEYTGVSVFYVDEGIDSGPILIQKKIEVGNKTQQELIRETKKLGMEAIADAVNLIHKDEVRLIPNDANQKILFFISNKG